MAAGRTSPNAPHAAETQLMLQHGQPMIFGPDDSKGLRLRPGTLELEVVTLGENGITADDLLVHDETNRNMAFLLAGLEPPQFPIALGVLYHNPTASYEGRRARKNAQATERLAMEISMHCCARATPGR